VLPLSGAKYPSSHEAQTDEPVALFQVPGEHLAEVLAPVIATKEPAGASRQAVCPVSGWYLPTEQSIQPGPPPLLDTLPAGHAAARTSLEQQTDPKRDMLTISCKTLFEYCFLIFIGILHNTFLKQKQELVVNTEIGAAQSATGSALVRSGISETE
jgi:hypothetical protein